MVNKLLLASTIMIAAGLALTLLSSPIFRVGTFGARYYFNGTFPGAGSGGFVPTVNRGYNLLYIIGSLIGYGLAGIGLVLEVVAMFTMRSRSQPTTSPQG